MKVIELLPGTRLEVSWPGAEPSGHEAAARPHRVYISQLLEPFRDGKLVIAVPISGFRLVQWPGSSRIQIVFTMKDSGIWSFTASLNGRIESGQIAAWEIKPADDLVRLQRRNWYRLPCMLDLTVRQKVDSDGKDSLVFHAITRDISGGGLSITTGLPVRAESEIEVTLQFENRDPLVVHGRILRIRQLEDPKDGRHVISLQFTDITPRDQDSLTQYVLRRQRQDLRRSRGHE